MDRRVYLRKSVAVNNHILKIDPYTDIVAGDRSV
jgi:hypothetical protein